MPHLKRISGAEAIAIFQKFGFELHSQHGSHCKLLRIVGTRRQVLIVPLHKELDTGTLRAIIRQASRFIPQSELDQKFRA
ncbi:MAG: type II toxin-antitoxin system HicA family toxin [bacterium]|nr:type II toxin-antitoxin system HicA family toxin [bacterium]